MLLLGDIGGTKTLLRLATPEGKELRSQRFDSRASTLPEIIGQFLGDDRPDVAVLGVAGPVFDGRVATTNLPWQLDERALSADCRIRRVKLLNDFEATAAGVRHVDPSQLVTLQDGVRVDRAPIGVIGAGTGLGVAILVWGGSDHVVIPTEGGHADFAPRTDLEVTVMRHLREKHGRVSVERVVSGMGIHAVYDALRAAGARESEAVAREMVDEDPSAVIGKHALANDDVLCAQTIDFFIAAYGAEAGNLALRTLARGGVYITGGIAPKLLPRMKSAVFIDAFRGKGRLSALAAEIPVQVVLDPELPLVGALHVAQQLR
jgi:glucokinase